MVLEESAELWSQVNCVKKDEIINGKFISSIFFPNCEEDDTSYYSATILEFVANGAKEQTDCWFEVKLFLCQFIKPNSYPGATLPAHVHVKAEGQKLCGT